MRREITEQDLTYYFKTNDIYQRKTENDTLSCLIEVAGWKNNEKYC